ncbi:MAG TPA: hypothetical protein PKD86_19005 [Gemmatales bacterium]|nr:hypothetical protein [Gemmatales bacterium]
MRRFIAALLIGACCSLPSSPLLADNKDGPTTPAAPTAPATPTAPAEPTATPPEASPPAPAPADPKALPEKLPRTKLPPAKVMPNLSVYHYRVSTDSPECQTFVDQGLAFFYSYMWMEAARNFETAIHFDPQCAIAWWCLSRAQDQWTFNGADALKKANELAAHASYPEQQLIKARMQERGLLPDVGDQEARKKAAIATLDYLLALHDDDQEAWFARAQLANGGNFFGGSAASVAFYKALLRLNTLHPGANHELVHYYELAGRPNLGWANSENYIRSSPGVPHSWHMQAHLATRLGRWNRATASSLRGCEVQRAYQKTMNVTPRQDYQFEHHLEILMMCLIHDGRFREARALRAECEGYGFKHHATWFRLALAERDYDAALALAELQRRRDKIGAAHMAALVYLARHEPARAEAEVEVLEEALREQKQRNRTLELRVWETRGWLLVQTDGVDAGLALLKKAVDATKDDYSHHAWGNGAYYMETWGIAALSAGRLEIAEEAFLEALAHDSGSVRGAMGMQILCERQDRQAEARHFGQLARRYWKNAEVARFDAEFLALQRVMPGTAVTARSDD